MFKLTESREVFKHNAVTATETHNVDILMHKDRVPAPDIDVNCVGK